MADRSVAAIVVVGGGYFAWSAFAPDRNTQPQLDDPYPAEFAAPLDESQVAAIEDVVVEDAAPAPAETRAAPVRRARVEPVPEATIGVASAETSSGEIAGTESDEIVVTGSRRPVWARTPSPRRLSALYPARALERGREGEARLHCIVRDGGALDCERASETSRGFGAAALRVARTFRHAPHFRDGSDAIGAPVNLRVVFRIEDDERERRFASR